MGIVRKVWNVTPAVIIGKKVQKAASQKREEKAERKQKAEKEKTLSLSGEYFSSHPEIHGQNWLKLEFGNDGVFIYGMKMKKNTPPIKKFIWNEILGYSNETEDKTQIQTTQRLTATRIAAVGVFSLAAPKTKKHGSVKGKFYDVLKTTSGDIELEAQIDSGNAGGSIGDLSRSMASLAIARREANIKNVRRYVAEHATGNQQA